MADSDAPTQPDGTDPAGDTPEPDGQDTAQNTQDGGPVDWEARYKALQPELTRQSQARADAERERDDLLARLAEPDEEVDEEAVDDEPAPPPRKRGRESAEAAALRERAERAEWQIAEAVHGPEVIQAYATTQRMLARAQTPSDYITALEAYHQARSGGASPQQAAQGGETQPQAEPPRSDPNRSDMAPAPSVDPTQFAGGQNGGSRGFFSAAVKQALGQR